MNPKVQTTTDQSDKLPISTNPSFVSGRLGHQRHHKDQLQTQAYLAVKPRPGSLQINLLFTIFAEQALNADRVVQTFIFFRRQYRPSPPTKQSFARPRAVGHRWPARPEHSSEAAYVRQDTKWWS